MKKTCLVTVSAVCVWCVAWALSSAASGALVGMPALPFLSPSASKWPFCPVAYVRLACVLCLATVAVPSAFA
eukprot:871709-Prorocentrum_lima.AAC.1